MKLMFPVRETMYEKGQARVAHVPFLINKSGQYLDLPNRYLRERALLEWVPADAHPVHDPRERTTSNALLRYPTITTLRNIGERLKNFLLWCESIDLDWVEANYTEHLIFGYQSAMLKGTWSARGTPLAGATVNQRVDEATLLVTWGEQTGLRPPGCRPFRVPSKVSRVLGKTGKSSRQRGMVFIQRAGRANSAPGILILPDGSEKVRWLNNVYSQRGLVKGLCCELILRTGIRISECVGWEVDCLPKSKHDWNIKGDSVLVLIRANTKGPKNEPYGSYGPPRWIPVPLKLAERLHSYRQNERVAQQARWIRSAVGSSNQANRRAACPPKQLFLGERSNRPFSARMLRDAWCRTPGCNPPWSPHLGRHSFACETLIALTKARLQSAGRSLGELNSDWLMGTLANDITVVIRPIMGHVSDETTNLYLSWVKVWFESQTEQGSVSWQDYLESEDRG